jgi:anti-sigma B factor antagonist
MPDYRVRVLQTAGRDAVIQVIGEVDLVGSYAFRERLADILCGGAARTVVDLSAADYVDTNGLSALWDAAKRCTPEGRELAIVCPEGRVRRALATTGLDEVMEIHATLDAALGRDDRPA